MLKKDKRGFALAETLIVSVVVAGILIYIFIQFSSLKRSYNTSFKYNTVNGLYALEDVANYIKKVEENNMELINGYLINEIDNQQYILITKNGEEYEDNVESYETVFSDAYATELFNQLEIKQLIITKENLSELDDSDFDESIKQFIKRIKYDKDTNNYRLIAKFEDNTLANLVIKVGASNE